MASPLKDHLDVNNNIPECECTNLTENDILTNVPERPENLAAMPRTKCVSKRKTKAELCLRVNKCVESGGPFTFCDPNPGKPHIQKKKQLCCVCNIDKTLVIKATHA